MVAAFCETFDQPANGGTRTGDLDPVVWGVSRLGYAFPNNSLNQIFDTNLVGCGNTHPVATPADVRICNGQLIEAQNDGHQVDNIDIYPKQPFDFTGRTGTIAFDVSADSEGPHAAWPEIIITDKPVPAARQDISNDPNQNNVIPPAAANEIGVVFAGGCIATDNTTGVSEIYVTRNNVFARVPMTQTNCVTRGSSTKMNHFEVRVSQNHIEVWGTDAGSTTLKQVAVADNIGLTLTRGLVWMADTHYNACKFNTQCDHTFAWDNFGFDGPKTYRDLGFDVPDNTTRPDANSTNTGYLISTGPMTLTVTGVHHDQTPTAAQIVFNYWNVDTTVPTISINDNPPITTPGPFAASDTWLWKTISVPIPLNQTHDGNNTITFTSTDGRTIVTNISLILVAAATVPNTPLTSTTPPPPTTVPPTTTIPPNTTSTSVPPTTTVPPTTSTTVVDPATGSCGLVVAAFCETFDQPANGGTRTGDLDPVVWGVSRLGYAFPNNSLNQIFDTNLVGCGNTHPVATPADVRICNGQLIEAQNDGHQVDNIDIYPKQPFDFTGRTGTIAFDVSADSEGPHAAWPEIIITDKPVPAARQDISNDPNQNNVIPPAAANEIGVVFAGGCIATDNTTGVSEIYVTRNNVFARVPMTQTNCVTRGSSTKMNHFEVRVSQNHIEVWGTDAGSTTLKQVAVADNIGLTLTRGLVWMADTHYNACKFNTQCDHTFAWDNFGFDGPKTYRDLGFDVPDNTTRPDANSTNTGYLISTGPMTLTVTGVHHDQTPTAAQIVFNYWNVDTTVPTISINDNPPITTPGPFAASDTWLWKTISVPIPLNQTHDGNNTITFTSTDGRTIVTNISLILVAAATVP